ncbi:MAG TPA: iron-sulfur cluster assembly accessory protein [Terracidiphilus sp.]|nr:iron-sulfur cluster assembly accessory protein [Terracidiphilus sp.]
MASIVTIGQKPEEGAQAPQKSVPQAPPDGILVTASAAEQIRTVLSKEGVSAAEGGLRLGVKGGGCSGLSYAMQVEARPRETDRIFEFDGVRVFIDPKSFVYLHGITLDYESTLIRQGFNFINPNSTRSCGCGSSFSV